MTAFGDALLHTWGAHPRLKSYDAIGWHAQISKLTESQRGYDAMAAAGIHVTGPTLVKWLTQDQREDFAPSAANRSKIRAAYDIMAGGWDSRNERRPYTIHGLVKTGTDVRNRGSGHQAPFLVDGSKGDWSAIRDQWNAGRLTSEDAEDAFVNDVIGNDPALEITSDPWEFPGDSYTIT